HLLARPVGVVVRGVDAIAAGCAVIVVHTAGGLLVGAETPLGAESHGTETHFAPPDARRSEHAPGHGAVVRLRHRRTPPRRRSGAADTCRRAGCPCCPSVRHPTERCAVPLRWRAGPGSPPSGGTDTRRRSGSPRSRRRLLRPASRSG